MDLIESDSHTGPEEEDQQDDDEEDYAVDDEGNPVGYFELMNDDTNIVSHSFLSDLMIAIGQNPYK